MKDVIKRIRPALWLSIFVGLAMLSLSRSAVMGAEIKDPEQLETFSRYNADGSIRFLDRTKRGCATGP